MLAEPILRQHLELQNSLNSLVDPNWLNAEHDWTRAIMVESVELLDHMGWKWWKAHTYDANQVRLELVDIWHFILSEELVGECGDINNAATKLEKRMREEPGYVPMGYHTANINELDAHGLVHVLCSMAGAGYIAYPAYERLRMAVGLGWDELDVLYRSKNVLNIFRQAHGYKEGTYIKTWAGQEDNEVLTNLIRTRPDATVEQLMSKLESIYLKVTA